jgi:hypothetical protein
MPDAAGNFTQVKYQTMGAANNQIMPGIYSKPYSQWLHTVGFGFSDYNLEDVGLYSSFETKMRAGVVLSFAYQHSFLQYLDMRHSFTYKRQGFGLRYDTLGVFPGGTLEAVTEGYQRMEYIGFSNEIGMPLNRRFTVFTGFDFDIRLNNVVDVTTKETTTLNNGKVTSEIKQTDDYSIDPDNIDLNVSLALECNLGTLVRLNLSVRRDFGGVRLNGLNGSGSGNININSTVYQLRAVVPFGASARLSPKAYLFGY